jgi:excinuclease ABC subunit B
MQQTIDETQRRREKQVIYNEKHGITPQQVKKGNKTIFEQSGVLDNRKKGIYVENEGNAIDSIAADPVMKVLSVDQIKKSIEQTKKKMEKAARDMEFMEAARLRDEMFGLQKLLEEKSK